VARDVGVTPSGENADRRSSAQDRRDAGRYAPRPGPSNPLAQASSSSRRRERRVGASRLERHRMYFARDPATGSPRDDSGRPRTTRNDVAILNLGAISGPFPEYARSAILRKARICRPFSMPEEGLEPPTRGL
jgi:hypothetical protein